MGVLTQYLVTKNRDG